MWHSGCYAIFRVDGIPVSYVLSFAVENDDDYKDYESAIKPKTGRTRKILTDNSTYLFYDQDRSTLPQDHYPYRRDSSMSKNSSNKETPSVHKVETDVQSVVLHYPLQVQVEENDDYGYVSPLHQEEESDQSRPNFFSTNERVMPFSLPDR